MSCHCIPKQTERSRLIEADLLLEGIYSRQRPSYVFSVQFCGIGFVNLLLRLRLLRELDEKLLFDDIVLLGVFGEGPILRKRLLVEIESSPLQMGHNLEGLLAVRLSAHNDVFGSEKETGNVGGGGTGLV